MFGSHPTTRRLAGVALALLCLGAGRASADGYFGMAGGAIVPYSGSTGWTVLMEMGTDWTSQHVRVGGELVFADMDRNINLAAIGGGVAVVNMRTYEARFVTRYVMFPGKITPYVGVGAGLIVVDLDDNGLRQAVGVPGLVRSSGQVGFGGGVDGHIGLEIPLFSKNLNLFGEGRAKYNWEFTNNLSPVAGPDNYNGFSAVMGIRGRY